MPADVAAPPSPFDSFFAVPELKEVSVLMNR